MPKDQGRKPPPLPPFSFCLCESEKLQLGSVKRTDSRKVGLATCMIHIPITPFSGPTRSSWELQQPTFRSYLRLRLVNQNDTRLSCVLFWTVQILPVARNC